MTRGKSSWTALATTATVAATATVVALALTFAVVQSCTAAENPLVQDQRAIRRDSFNLRFNLTVNGPGSGEIYFHLDAGGNGYLLKVGRTQGSPPQESGRTQGSPLQDGEGAFALGKFANGKFAAFKPAPDIVPATGTLLIKKRGSSIAVYLDAQKIITVDDAAFQAGTFAWRSSGGVSISDGSLQDVSDIFFTDDFMRTTRATGAITQSVESHGSWTPASGNWVVLGPGNPETSTAVFQLCHRGNAKQPVVRGVYRAGYWFWDDYVFAASVRFGSSDDLVALRFYETAADSYFLLEWDGAAKVLRAIRVASGDRSDLTDRSDTGFMPEQWYRIKLMVLGERMRGFVDDVPVFNIPLPGAVGGAIGLEASGADVRFDDVQVFGLKMTPKQFADDASEALHEALATAENQERLTEKFSHETTMKEWATSEGAWHPVDAGRDSHADRNGQSIEWHQSVFYQGMLEWAPGGVLRPLRSPPPAVAVERGTVALLLAPEPGVLEQGYRAVCSFDAKAGWSDVSIFEDGDLETEKHFEGPPRNLKISADSRRVTIAYGDEPLLKASRSAATVAVAAYRSFAFGRHISGRVEKRISVSSDGELNYPFSRAPSDWFTTGTWELHPRWTCDQRYTWFSGVNKKGTAELWNKTKFEGDCTVEAFVACMLLGQFPHYDVPINFRVTVGADQMKPNRGYTCIYRWVDGPAEILRNGIQVAADESEVDTTLFRDHPNARGEHMHRWWLHLKIQKRGNEIRFYVDRKLWLKFTDDQPLNGPFICLWTENNGIMVSRVKITYEKTNGKALLLR